jgi:hypothetical protein
MLSLVALLLSQGPALDVTTSVDRSRVAVGEEVVFTLRAVGHTTAAFRADLPSLDGFALLERTERTDIVYGARELTRAYILELHLRAEQVGTWSIGPIRVEHGVASAFSTGETVTVVNAAGGSAAGLDPDLVALIPRVPSPRVGGPSVFTVASASTVYAGDQVDVLTAAWLPRSLRLRLRQPPTLSPPALPGVWSTPRRAVPGAVASRVVDGENYDLFVGFQTVYPLDPGALPIPPARLTWMQPSGRQYFSEERRESVESGPLTLTVRPLPDAGRPAGFDGPVARDLRIEYRLAQGAARAGAVLPVEIALSGAGNLPLWPTPKVSWPSGIRVYEEGSEITPRTAGPRLGGSKTFKFSVVPDSAGTLSLPALEYSYFDPAPATYRLARALSIAIPVLDALPVADRRSALPIEQEGPPSLPVRIVTLPWSALAALISLPILAMAAMTLRRRYPRKRAAPVSGPDPAHRLDALLELLAPPDARPSPVALAGALRAAGIDREGAERLVRLHAELVAQRFGRESTGQPSSELLRDIDDALGRLPRAVRWRGGPIPALVSGMLAAAILAPALHGQSGIELYTHGEYAAAAQAFRQAANAKPWSAALWYDVAASEYLARRDANSAAALLAARQLAPRDPRVDALWNALAREHEPLRRAGTVWPLTAEECLAAALLLVWIGAPLFLILRRRRWLSAIPLLLAVAVAAAGFIRRAERRAPRAVLAGGASLRLSPHGLAPERGTIPSFSVVRLERRVGRWWLILTQQGIEGWVPEEILSLAPALD